MLPTMSLVETTPLILAAEESESVDHALSPEALSALSFSIVGDPELFLDYT